MAIDPKKNVESALLNGDGETNKTEQKTLEGIQVNGCSKSDQATNGIDNNAVNGDNEPEVEKKESDAENKTKSKPVVRYDE